MGDEYRIFSFTSGVGSFFCGLKLWKAGEGQFVFYYFGVQF